MELVVNVTTRALYSRERHPVPFYMRLGEPQGRYERVRKIPAPLGLHPTVRSASDSVVVVPTTLIGRSR